MSLCVMSRKEEGLLPGLGGHQPHTTENAFIHHMPPLILLMLENNIEMTESSSESEFEADFSEEEFTDSDDQHINEAGQIVPYMYEPKAKSSDSDNGGEITGVRCRRPENLVTVFIIEFF